MNGAPGPLAPPRVKYRARTRARPEAPPPARTVGDVTRTARSRPFQPRDVTRGVIPEDSTGARIKAAEEAGPLGSGGGRLWQRRC